MKLFVYTIHDARISTSVGTKIWQNTFVGPISNNMRLLAHRDGDLSTYFDFFDDSEDGIKIHH